MANRVGAAVLAVAVAACSGEVVQQPGDGGAGTTTATKPTPTTTGTPTPTTVTVTGTGGAGNAPPCFPVDGGSGGFMDPVCADLSVMNVTDPVLADESGDGKLSYLEKAALTVKLNEIAGIGFNWYPGVHFSSETVSIPAPDNAWFYAILACDSYDAVAEIQLLTDLPKGTVVHVKAQVGMLNTDCPDAPSIDIPIQVE